MMTRFYTYLHCKPNGDPFYVGKGTGRRCYQFSTRSYHHKNIVSKYGIENINIFVFPCETEYQSLLDEIHQIAQLRLDGYKLCNQTDGGEGSSGKVVTKKTRLKIGAANIGKKRTPEQREKMSAVMLGNKHTLGKKLTETHRKKISDGLKNCNHPWRGKHLSEETKQKLLIANTGREVTEETKLKLSIAGKGRISPMKGKKHTPETKIKMSIASKGRLHTEESIKKMSDAHKGKKFSIEHRMKISQNAKTRIMSEKTKKKISEANKGNKYALGKTHTVSEETRLKMSVSAKGKQHWLGKKHSPETILKMSESAKKRQSNKAKVLE